MPVTDQSASRHQVVEEERVNFEHSPGEPVRDVKYSDSLYAHSS